MNLVVKALRSSLIVDHRGQATLIVPAFVVACLALALHPTLMSALLGAALLAYAWFAQKIMWEHANYVEAESAQDPGPWIEKLEALENRIAGLEMEIDKSDPGGRKASF